jgi:HEPN domain-containing protein/predicted nucleotidyltransferase
MLTTVEDITKRIVDIYEPDLIILYGSHAKGSQRDGSDADILIIKQTDERPIDRRIRVESIISNRLIPLDITVYTPQEFRYLFSLGSPFVEEIIKEGKVIYMRKVTKNWLRDAQDELESASILFEHGKYRGTCYHSQQCVEKGLKSLILEKGERPERIHDIVEILNKATKLGWGLSFPMDDAIFLNSIYKGRYPTEEGLLPYGEPTKEEAEKALLAAQKLIRRVQELIV